MTITAGEALDLDIYAACDCGDLHMGKQITVSGLAGSGLTYDPQTGRLSGTPTQGSIAPTISVTNAIGQSASKQITLTVAAPSGPPAYASWTGPGWFDFSDDASLGLSGSTITSIANRRAGGVPLFSSGAAISRVAGAQNGRPVARFTRDTANPARLQPSTDGADPISVLNQGEDKPFTVITAYKPTDANTGYIWSWSDTVDATDSQQLALIRRTSNASVRRQLVTATTNDVSWGAGQPGGTARIVAVVHTGTALSVWDNSLAKIVSAAPQDTAAFNNELIFRVGATEFNKASDPSIAGVACAMDFMEIIIEGEAKSDADVQQAMTDLAAKWGVVLT